MSLAPGTHLGPYEIVSLLGTGGMGEVYRARDPRLGRDVAIKVLPSAFADDAERLRRFEQEARAAAALNHPNIVTVYSVEKSDGVLFLTMEVVEGRSLALAIPKGGFAIDELLTIAIPLADAVAAAHEKGITHRDLKPANIMIGAAGHAGRVKVLDFGLAKLIDPGLATAGASTMPAGPSTAEGRIVGTVAYMSPEQAAGNAIDSRSDLFSLGVILYEMATGQKPFKGDTGVSVLSSILKDTPVSVTDLKPGAAARARADHPAMSRERSVATLSNGRGSSERARGIETRVGFGCSGRRGCDTGLFQVLNPVAIDRDSAGARIGRRLRVAAAAFDGSTSPPRPNAFSHSSRRNRHASSSRASRPTANGSCTTATRRVIQTSICKASAGRTRSTSPKIRPTTIRNRHFRLTVSGSHSGPNARAAEFS